MGRGCGSSLGSGSGRRRRGSGGRGRGLRAFGGERAVGVATGRSHKGRVRENIVSERHRSMLVSIFWPWLSYLCRVVCRAGVALGIFLHLTL